MYYEYFGLEEAPFSIAVNPRYLYMSPRHRDALAHLLYGVGAGGGFILLTGEVGTGKTTINRCLMEQLPEHADVAIVLNPALDVVDLLSTVCEELGIVVAEQSRSLKSLTDALHRYLLENHARSRKTVLMIDEAQHLSFEALEQIRLLTNLETNDEKLLHIILIGQPELAAKLARPELRQLNQRITARFDLKPLTRDETAAYIRHRLQVAGLSGGRTLFGPGLVRAIHRQSRGVPRLINLICDRMLLGAYGENKAAPDKSLFRRAVREVLGPETSQGVSGFPFQVNAIFAGLVVVALGGMFWWLVLTESSAKAPAVTVDSALTTPVQLPAPEADIVPVAVEPATEDWRLSPTEGTEALLSLYGAERSGQRPNPCVGPLADDLRCEERQALSWNELLAQARPALLALIDERRFESRALLLELDNASARLATPTGIDTVTLRRLADEWSGSYWVLKRTSPRIQRVMKRDDRGNDVAELARLFARIDGQEKPLSDSLFNARLEARLKLFQRQAGLSDDGVLGEQTLSAVMLAAGEDMDFAAAQERWQMLTALSHPGAAQ
ncbi:MAG: ExeA family protein [Congregibacter sp.]